MSTENNRTKTDARTDDVEHAPLGERDRLAAGKHVDHQVIDAEVIDPDSGRDPKASAATDETRPDHRRDKTAAGGLADGKHTPVAARTAGEAEADLTGTRPEVGTDRDAIVAEGPGHEKDAVHAGREQAVTQKSPATEVEDDVVPLFDEKSLEQLRGRWRDLQGSFVDDPRDAVSQADNLVGELIHELTSTYAERQKTIAGRWSETPDTESLRRALRSYRAFFDQLLTPTA
ncbi:hypothetical protein QX204_10580 [Nocardia sp. PE-7]|uniref:hypothetical protein n=1 Tax=Nocardia sp. PE-7 TaxID=3058426 RepID=UPI002657D4EE|nr:hypothetical protein [Nocardia sp. PE-7]WKG11873.1 hypothetical protein QX204_10580 [Nocardia sp. PE-7]